MRHLNTAQVGAVAGLMMFAACASPQQAKPPGPFPTSSASGGPSWSIAPKESAAQETAAIKPGMTIPLEGLAGMWATSKFTTQLDTPLRQKIIDITQEALSRAPAGEKVIWSQASLTGTVTPQIGFEGPLGLSCREFHQQLQSRGTVETGYATACLDETGQWRLLPE